MWVAAKRRGLSRKEFVEAEWSRYWVMVDRERGVCVVWRYGLEIEAVGGSWGAAVTGAVGARG